MEDCGIADLGPAGGKEWVQLCVLSIPLGQVPRWAPWIHQVCSCSTSKLQVLVIVLILLLKTRGWDPTENPPSQEVSSHLTFAMYHWEVSEAGESWIRLAGTKL